MILVRAGAQEAEGEGRSATACGLWLPGSVPHSVIRDVIQIRLPSIVTMGRRAAAQRGRRGAAAVAGEWQRMLDGGTVRGRADLARHFGVSRARLSQVLS